ncbi:c-type cytochrome [Actibacterium sp. XHP0104]|uniref:c-type cytochrome n=1 Tax=Actibacterium sp. XHP0104 TaxID=2984335 RepID=UPI0021E90316|nr:cytochrome c [Actibacterium sp. XHP0104]MCV2881681.1 cytochrome c [Actibacterium sp. XHP0104]
MRRTILTFTILIVAGAAYGHSNVHNPVVQDRMENMMRIAAQMKRLGEMAKGAADFDPEIAAEAVARISARASAIPERFQAPETDPKSEAKPDIWENWPDFTAKADELTTIATSITIESQADLGPALSRLGGSCKACHTSYRAEQN